MYRTSHSSTALAWASPKSRTASFSYGVYSKEGELLSHGVEENWDEARLAMIENIMPPTGER